MIEVMTQKGGGRSTQLPKLLITSGSNLVITGAAGSGKTAFCLALAGLGEGEETAALIKIDGRMVLEMPPHELARTIGFVPSDSALAISGVGSTVEAELQMAWRLLGVVPSDAAVAEHAAIFGLDRLLKQDPMSLSGGETARLALALATAKKPHLLILDQVADHIDIESIAAISARLMAMLPQQATVVETRSRSGSIGLIPLSQQDRASASRDESMGWDIAMGLRSQSVPSSVGSNDIGQCSDESREAGASVPLAAPSETAVLIARRLSYRYGPEGFVLGPIDLAVDRGERIALIGPSGSGKTTLLKSLGLLVRPSYEQFLIRSRDGKMVSPPEKERRSHLWAHQALYCFQRPEDQFYLGSVRAELLETKRRVGGSGGDALALEIAEALGLGEVLDKSPFDLPRPQRRLLTIASALAAQSPVLLLDEPSASLDDNQLICLAGALKTFASNSGIIMVTHDAALLALAATRIVPLGGLRSPRSYQGATDSPALAPIKLMLSCR